MKCLYCQEECKRTSNYHRGVICENHPLRICYCLEKNLLTEVYDGPLKYYHMRYDYDFPTGNAMVYAFFYVEWNFFSIEILGGPQLDPDNPYLQRTKVVELDYIPKHITPENLHEKVLKYLTFI